MLHLALLGRIELRDAAGAEIKQLLRRPKLLAPLAYLAAARPHGYHRRDRLLGVFWPELDQGRARNALRQALHHLRSALGPEVLLTRGDEELAVDPAALQCDARVFAERLAAGEPHQALEIVRGEFLPSFHLKDTPEFERWLEEEREHLRRQAASAAGSLADAEETQGNLSGAAHWARRALQIAPYREDELRRLLGLLDRLGDRAGAVREYEAFARRLSQDLGVEPAPETQALIRGVRRRQGVLAASAEEETVAPVPTPAAGSIDAPPPRELTPPPHPTRRWRAVALALGAITVAAVTWALWPDGGTESVASEPASIAVLPLQNLSGDPDQEYFADGMTEEIIGELSQIAELRVISRTSVMQFKNADLPLRKIADSLGGVSHILEGSVMREGQRVRIRAQLVAVRPEENHLWSEAFERDAGDVLALQQDVARAVAGTLKGVLAGESGPVVQERRQVRPDVYEAYLRGLHLINDNFDFLGALREFDRAIALDSTFAPAWAATANAINGLRTFPPPNDTGRAMVPRQEAAARRAIALDPTLADGHGELAGYLITSGFPPFQRHLLEQAEREIQRALELAPGNPGARGSYAEALALVYGRHDEAITQARIALDLDPLSADRQAGLGDVLLLAGRVDEAIAQYRFALEWHPGHGAALEGLGVAYVQLGEFDDAVAAMRQHGDRTNLAWALAMAGRDAEARDIVEGRVANTRNPRDPDYVELAAVFGALEDLDRAFEYLEEAYRQQNTWLIFIRSPLFLPLRGDPRYDDLVRRIGFPEPE